MNKKVFILIDVYLKEGFLNLIIFLINYIFFKFFKSEFKIKNSISRYKNYLIKKIIDQCKGKVIQGLYKNIILEKQTHWDNDAMASKFLGVYENQVVNMIVRLQKDFGLKYFVNLGAGEGYHIIGMIKKKIFLSGFAFDISLQAQNILRTNIKNNNLTNKIHVFGKADIHQIKLALENKILKKVLFLIDIEGDEFNFFNKKNIRYFKESFFIIEEHPPLNNTKKKIDKLLKLFRTYFKINFIVTSSRDPNNIKELNNFSDDEKWLMMSESRPGKQGTQRWIVLTPKKHKF